ncbi:GNAT family N-acetyltransferase [bacterium]|nr:GNAT family N-acetyltransferase [bacterium]
MDKSSGYIVREVQIGDSEPICGILNRIIAKGNFTVIDGPISIESQAEYIRNYPHRGIFNVALCAKRMIVIGFQSVDCLANKTFKMAREKGFEKIFTYVRADNIGAIAWYLKMGFRVIGTALRQAKIGEKYCDEIIIEKFL